MLKKHGDRVLDYKNYFKIPRDSKKIGYKVDLWFFIPSNLHPHSYSRGDFFNDLSLYTRYNAPNITLTSLVDMYNERNPLFRLQTTPHNKENFNQIEYELKTLLNILKVSGLHSIETIKAMIKYSPYEAERNMGSTLENYIKVQNKLLDLYKTIPLGFTRNYLLAIEGVSIRIEKILYSFIHLIPTREEELLIEIKHQRSIRDGFNFDTIFSDNEVQNSRAIYREHLIKKWSESIMYISNESSRTEEGIKHLLMGSAAAVAMLIVGIITLLTTRWVGGETFFLFVMALLAYSLKDRIKDILKVIFLRRANSIMSDRVRNIVDPGNRLRCGKSKESLTFPDFENLPKKVREIRFKKREDLEIKQFQEEIVHYRRDVSLNSKKFYKNHSRLFGIKEIMRFDIRKWFYKMDKIHEKCYIPENGKLTRVRGEREYHFNVIVRTETCGETTLKRFRILANSKRIKEVIEVL